MYVRALFSYDPYDDMYIARRKLDGRDYHFITRSQCERDISNDLFVEHSEYEKNHYGTSKSAIETCCHTLNKICILYLLPEELDSLKY